MEDKERELFIHWITQVMQANVQLTTNLMQLAMIRSSQMMPPPMSANLGGFIPSGDDINKLMKGMFGKFDDKDKLT